MRFDLQPRLALAEDVESDFGPRARSTWWPGPPEWAWPGPISGGPGSLSRDCLAYAGDHVAGEDLGLPNRIVRRPEDEGVQAMLEDQRRELRPVDERVG